MKTNVFRVSFLIAGALIMSACSKKGSGPQDGRDTPAPQTARGSTTTSTTSVPNNSAKTRPATGVQNVDTTTNENVSVNSGSNVNVSTGGRGLFTNDPRYGQKSPAPAAQQPPSQQSVTRTERTNPQLTEPQAPSPEAEPAASERTSTGNPPVTEPERPGMTIEVVEVPPSSWSSDAETNLDSATAAEETTSSLATPTNDIVEPLDVVFVFGKDRVGSKANDRRVVDTLLLGAQTMDAVNGKEAYVIDDYDYSESIGLTEKLSVPYTLAEMVIESSACRFRGPLAGPGTGACVVMEKTTRKGVTSVQMYNLAALELGRMLWKGDTQEYVLFRTDLKDSQHGLRILRNEPNGIYIFTRAAAVSDIIQPELWENPEASLPPVSVPGPVVDSQKQARSDLAMLYQDGVRVAVTPEEKAAAEAAIAEIEAATAKHPRAPLVNEDRRATRCWVKARLTLQKGVFVVDFTSQIRRRQPDGSKRARPIKSGKGVLYCRLNDGTIQMPNIEVHEYQKFLRFGLAAGRLDTLFFGTGIGSPKGAKDIIDMRKFYYPVSADAHLAPFPYTSLGLTLAPIVLSCQNNQSVLAIGLAHVPAQQRRGVNLTVTVGGKYEIVIDPDGT